MSVIRWEDPPPTRKGKDGLRGWVKSPLWRAIADELRSQPGRWAVVAEDANPGVAGHIRRGHYEAFRPKGSFEARCVGSAGMLPTVYARYVGEPTDG